MPNLHDTLHPHDTLLGRCFVAYVEAFAAAMTSEGVAPAAQLHRTGIAAVLDHLAAEIAVMQQRAAGLTVHQVITIFRLEAAGQPSGLRLKHLATEIAVMQQQAPDLTAHQIIAVNRLAPFVKPAGREQENA